MSFKSRSELLETKPSGAGLSLEFWDVASMNDNARRVEEDYGGVRT